jgi:hypothetical protein
VRREPGSAYRQGAARAAWSAPARCVGGSHRGHRRWRVGHRIDVGVRAGPWPRRHRRPSRSAGSTLLRSRAGRSRSGMGDDAGQGRRLTPSRRWPRFDRRKSRSGSHGMLRRSPRNGPGGPPLWSARAGTLMPVARNRIRFIAIAIHLRQSRPVIPCPENGPFLFERRVPGRKSVIAVVPWRNPA